MGIDSGFEHFRGCDSLAMSPHSIIPLRIPEFCFNNNCVLVEGIYVLYIRSLSYVAKRFGFLYPVALAVIYEILDGKLPRFHKIYVIRCPINPRAYVKDYLITENLPTFGQSTSAEPNVDPIVLGKGKLTSTSWSKLFYVSHQSTLSNGVLM